MSRSSYSSNRRRSLAVVLPRSTFLGLVAATAALLIATVVGAAAGQARPTIAAAGYDVLVVTQDEDRVTKRMQLVSTSGRRPLELGRGFDAAWSPDGSRIAYSAVPAGATRAELYVMAADGTARRRLTHNDVRDRKAAWSPDGRSLVFVSGRDVATLSLAPEDRRIVVAAALRDDDPFYLDGSAPRWSPDGQEIALGVWDEDGADIALVRADGSGLRRIATGATPPPNVDAMHELFPRWSPDGSRITFSQYTVTGGTYLHPGPLWIAARDGTGARRLTEAPSEAADWRSDGRALLFASVTDPCVQASCRGAFEANGEITVVGLGGAQERSLPTGGQSSGAWDSFEFGPSWSREGSHILFLSSRVGRFDVWELRNTYHDSYFAAAYVMNADGSCATRLTYGGAARDVEQASWRPQSSSLPRLHCADLFVTLSTRSSDEVALASPLSDTATVENRGDRVAQAVVATFSVGAIVPVSASGRGARCRVAQRLVTCALGSIAPAAKRIVTFVGRSPSVGGNRAFVVVRAAARTREGDLSNNLDVLAHEVRNCTLLGTSARETFVGTPRRDLICGRDGNDTIRSLAGDDWINAGGGDDTVDPGPGRDDVLAKVGNDRIFAADGARDRIRCGEGADRVVADARDVVTGDCEDVVRR